jgi:hypothetical protein
MSSIFVQIPCYHDFELSRTIKSCINKSSGNNKINFGIHLTYFNKNEIEIPSLSNIKFSLNMAPENLGVGMSRYLANEFYDGEDYYLQIDSHMKFEKNWDENLIENYKKYLEYSEKPVISNYPGAYEYQELKSVKINNKNDVFSIDFIQDLSFKDNYVPHQRAVEKNKDTIFSKSVSAASIFSSGEIALIKPNQKIFFWGEEILTAIRLYTHGFDIMTPEYQNFYHLYYNNNKQAHKNLRRQVNVDFPEESAILEKISQEEFSKIILNQAINDQALGSKRTLKDYQDFAGIDFVAKSIR